MNHEKIEQDVYEKFWKTLKGGFSKDTTHYASDIPYPAIEDFFAYIEGEGEGKAEAKGKVLDAGCGNGRHAIYAARQGYVVTAMDFACEAVSLAKKQAVAKKTYVECVQGSVLDMPFSHDSFDVVIDSGCLHHLRTSQWPAYRREITRVLKPGGYYFLLTFSNRSGYIPKFTPQNMQTRQWVVRNKKHYSYFFSYADIVKLFQKNFTIKKHYHLIRQHSILKFRVFYIQKNKN